MKTIKGSCLKCGAPLKYAQEAKDFTCVICGKSEMGHCACENDHYICNNCHRKGGVDLIMDACLASNAENPIELAKAIMQNAKIYPNGPEHHTLVGAVLLACFKNAGGDIELEDALSELRARSMQIPGGTCGFWGCCGAAISAGQYYSIVSKSTPLTRDPWARTARLTSNIIGKIADVGGPRCCKRTSFIALEEAVRYTADTLDIEMELPDENICIFMGGNAECLKQDCPYSPNCIR